MRHNAEGHNTKRYNPECHIMPNDIIPNYIIPNDITQNATKFLIPHPEFDIRKNVDLPITCGLLSNICSPFPNILYVAHYLTQSVNVSRSLFNFFRLEIQTDENQKNRNVVHIDEDYWLNVMITNDDEDNDEDTELKDDRMEKYGSLFVFISK